MAELRSRGRGGSPPPLSSAPGGALPHRPFLFFALPPSLVLLSSLQVHPPPPATPPLPTPLWTLRAFFQSTPGEPEHAALIGGANRAQALLYVVAPLALPGIIATAIFTFIVAWNDFLFALVLIGRDELKTLAIGINDFFHMAVVDWGLIMAAGVMVTIPALVFFIAVQRYLIAGWGAGGLKG